ncbi:MAG TPA: DMT family transporter [Terriglobales bacterium]|nr:DMT family transporter [Terriglobales bacterium]
MSSRPAANPGKGIIFYLIGVFFFACNDALGKWLVADYSVGEIMLLRAVGAVPILVLVAIATKSSLKIQGHWPLHIFRVLCLTGDSFSFYYATRSMPLADVMTYYMAAPLIITAFSFFLLGERVRLFRWTAVIVGFVGVIIALQPTGAAFSPAAVIALIGATLFGLSIVITRKLSDVHWLPLVTWQFFGAGLIGAGVSVFDWVTPGAVDIFLMFLVGIVSAACFVLITKALSIAPASLLAPFQYSAILWAALLGWIIWHDAPTMHIVIGNCIIIGSGLVIFYRESRIKVNVSRERVEPIP